jgi:hypothetical protein
VVFLLSHLGTGLYYIDSTALPVCDNHRIRSCTQINRGREGDVG